LDSDRQDFGPTRQLREMADVIKAFYAHCDFGVNGSRCRKPARYNYFKGKKPGQVVVGAFDLYGAACERHDGVFRQQYGLPPVQFVRTATNRTKWPRIEVGADSMRVGKTTAVKVLVDGFAKAGIPVTARYEEWQLNPYLRSSYTDPFAHLLTSQQWFLSHKYRQVKTRFAGVIIQDLPPEMDYLYAVTNARIGRMRTEDFEAYQHRAGQMMWEEVLAPDLLIYLKISDEELIRRATKAARPFEVVDTDYFLALKETNRTWLATIKKYWQVLEIDTDEINFARAGKGRDGFITEVRKWVGR
jgi:deoxyadenosine/deoxycytidine kinase